MEVNEKIVEEYLKTVKGWFYMSDIPFEVPRNFSNIDILAYNPKENEYYDIEVKYRSVFKISKNDIEKENGEFSNLLKQFCRKERNNKIKKIIGENHEVTKVFVTTRQYFGKTDRTIEEKFLEIIKKDFKKSEVWYFDDIIPELFEHTDINGRYNSELLQTVRLTKTYLKKNIKKD